MVKQHIHFGDDFETTTNVALDKKLDNPFSVKNKQNDKQNDLPKSTAQPSHHPPQINGAAAIVKHVRKRAVDFFDNDAGLESAKETNQVQNGASKYVYSPQTPVKRQKMAEDRQALPIAKHEKLLRKKIRDNSVIILQGETGSGKSTQLPQFLLQDFPEGAVAVTQPRRVAAISLAKRVAEEMDVRVGREVGYSIRFDDMSSKDTRIKYLTDGMLLIELLRDPLLSRYSVVILDEAHERTLLTDLLLGFMKMLVKRRMGLKVVVMSATLDADRFSAFFDDAEIVYIEGRTFPVDLYYSRVPQPDYADAILRTIFQLHMGQATGDLLVFLTGSDEIESLAKQVRAYAEQLPRDVPKLLVLPLYASLPQDQQARVFHATPRHTRKIILATNIAETSITVPGVRYVIDSGLQKIKAFNPLVGFEWLQVSPISQSNANQRAGRAGREAPGKCWRIYSESTYEALDGSAEAEIKRIDLSQAILALKARGVSDVLGFPYIDVPSRDAILRALEQLYALGALNDSGNITALGTQMSSIPLPPPLARVLLAAAKEDCVAEVIDIVSCLSVDGVFLDSPDKREEAAEARRRFESAEGDHLTLLNVLREFMQVSLAPSKWCETSFLDYRALRNVVDIRRQLRQHAQRARMKLADDADDDAQSDSDAAAPALKQTIQVAGPERILRAFLAGFVAQTAFLSPDGSYRTTSGNHAVAIHPASVLYGKKVEAILYHESIFTTRLWVRGVSRVESAWVKDVAPTWAGRQAA